MQRKDKSKLMKEYIIFQAKVSSEKMNILSKYVLTVEREKEKSSRLTVCQAGLKINITKPGYCQREGRIHTAEDITKK